MSMKQTTSLLVSTLLLGLTFSSCDSPSGLSSQGQASSQIGVRVNLIASQNPQQPQNVQISDLSQLPGELQSAAELEVIFDSSKTSIKVQRHADGSLSFPLSTGRSFDSNKQLNILMVGDRQFTYALQLQTGSLFQLGDPPILAEPGSTVTLGTRLRLRANLQNQGTAEMPVLTWEAASSAAGPWQIIPGTQTEVEWEPRQAGAYYLRLRMTDPRTQSLSTYLSPTPQIYVQSASSLALTAPASGSIVAGETIGLKLNLPEYTDQAVPNAQWLYASSNQGPFQPITGRGSELTWEPPGTGAYFLQVQIQQNGRLSTYTSDKPQVLVAAADEIIATEPATGSVIRGQSVVLAAALADLPASTSYSWFYGFSPQGSFQPIAATGARIEWTPPVTGEFFLRLRVHQPETGQSQTYTSSKTLVSVRDSNQVFVLNPDPGNISKGQSVQITLNAAETEQVNWSYGSDLQGSFQAIPTAGKTIRWTPAEPGRFYLRAAATRADGSIATFTSADPLVFVNEPAQVIRVQPALGKVELGQSVNLRAEVNEPGVALRYQWSYSATPQGPFQALPSLADSSRQSVSWYPDQAGAYFIKVDITNPLTQSQVSFTSQEALVRVSETQPFFSTDPATGRIQRNDEIRIRSRFEAGGRGFNLGWSYASSSAGPFMPMGGSTVPEFNWDTANKPTGSYFVRLQATPTGGGTPLNFVSRYPLIFISESDASSSSFGIPANRQ